jgi:RNA polymerase sigma-70 factor (ECF subfamily)
VRDSDLPTLAALDARHMTAARDDETLEATVGRLYAALRVPVTRYLIASFGITKDAEDVAQETFLQLFRLLKAGQRVDQVRAWVFRVAHNIAVNRLGEHRFVTIVNEDAWQDLCAVAEDPSSNPEQQALETERLRLIERGMRQLSTQQRQCLLLRIEGLRYREIGEVLGVTTSTVAESLRRAMRKLTRALHE